MPPSVSHQKTNMSRVCLHLISWTFLGIFFAGLYVNSRQISTMDWRIWPITAVTSVVFTVLRMVVIRFPNHGYAITTASAFAAAIMILGWGRSWMFWGWLASTIVIVLGLVIDRLASQGKIRL